ncbi:exosortase/archaeosortase family protein [Saccharospirillum salsuginis]|uniref:Exosortase n=1 Tax=Saccharospirillum salsuginis TaxID=418750 RepID=A0A918K6E5_9GAMM|nr:exosortase/archaeosortase family protein [Saccharospirillum salsuginis]GGX49725.1 hypothetical protein GCM10007392_16370 [Saccharospirillum salsuginis]
MLRTSLHNLPRSWPFLLSTLLAVVLFAPTWLRLFELWLRFDQVLAHGLPTFLLYLGLLIVHPPRESKPEPYFRVQKSNWPILGSLFLITATLSWVVLELVNIDTLSYLMLPFGIATVTWVMLGFHAAIRLVPHLLVLSLSLPFWGDLIAPLVSLASLAVGKIVGWMGMTALIEGSSITLPYGRLLIADGCSGIRYFAISILLAATIALLNDYRWRGWLTAIALAGALGILSNWVRITGLVIIGYQSEMQSSLMQEHETYGWLIYAVFALPALYLAPVKRREPSTAQSIYRTNKTGWSSILIAVLVGPALLAFAQGSVDKQPAWIVVNEQFRTNSHGRPPLPINIPDILQSEQYHIPDHDIWLNLAQYQRDHSDKKLVPYIGNSVDSDLWQQMSAPKSQNGDIRLYRNVINQKQVAVAQRYKVSRFSTDSYRVAKLLQIPGTFLNDNRFALVTLQTSCHSLSCQSEMDRLSDVLANLRLETRAP